MTSPEGEQPGLDLTAVEQKCTAVLDKEKKGEKEKKSVEAKTLEKLQDFQKSYQLNDKVFNPAQFMELARKSFDDAFAGADLSKYDPRKLFETFLSSRVESLTGEKLVPFEDRAELGVAVVEIDQGKVKNGQLKTPAFNELRGEETTEDPFYLIDNYIAEIREMIGNSQKTYVH